MRLRRAAATLLAPLLASACVVGPNYRRPEPTRIEASAFQAAAPGAAEPLPLPPHWWTLFQDPALDALVETALANNTDLRVAAANLRRERAVLREVRSQRLPTTEVTGGVDYGRGTAATRGSIARIGGATGTADTGNASGGSGDSSNGGTTGEGPTTSAGGNTDFAFSGGVEATWEVDLFGRITRGIQAARADVAATAAAEDDARVTVASDTTETYLQVCALGQQIDVATAALELVGQTYKLTQKQVQLGAASDFDLARVGVLVEQTRATIPELQGQRDGALYALAVLTGKPPAAISPEAAACRQPPKLSRPIPTGDGLALIRRRPDVREAERTLAADVARIGVATADLFPTITIGGSVSADGSSLKDAVSRSGLSFGVGPLISWFFPNISAARARLQQSRAQAEASLASFDGTVLTALRDTEQALASYASEIRRNQALTAAQANAQRAYQLSQVQANVGSISELELIDVQRDLVSSEQALAASNQTLAEDQVAVFRALGGGWEQAPPVHEVTFKAATKSAER